MRDKLKKIFGDVVDELRGESPLLVHLAGEMQHGSFKYAAMRAGLGLAVDLITRKTHRQATEQEEAEFAAEFEQVDAARDALAAVDAILAPVQAEPTDPEDDDEAEPVAKGKKRK